MSYGETRLEYVCYLKYTFNVEIDNILLFQKSPVNQIFVIKMLVFLTLLVNTALATIKHVLFLGT